MRRGTRVGQAYVAVTADGSGINAEIVDAVDEAGPGVEKAGDEHGERYGERFSEGFLSRMRTKVANRLRDQMSSMGERGGEEAGTNFTKGLIAKIDNSALDHIGDRLGARFAEHINDSLGERMELAFAQLADDMDASFAEAMKGKVSGNKGASVGRPGDQGFDVGSLLGRGSRNDALNLFGSVAGGITSLISKMTKAATGLASTFVKGFTSAAEGAGFFQKVLSGLGAVVGKGGTALGSLAKAGPAVVAALLAVGAAVVGLTSLIGALLGIVVALASTLATALVGALAIGAGAMGAMAAAGGLLTAAFMSMTDAQQDLLANAFRPLKAEMVGIGQIMLRDMVPAFAVWSQNLQQALLLLAPVAQVMGSAFAQAGTQLTAALSGPGFQALSTALGTFLPSIITRLSSALGGFLNGAAGLFATLLPYVNQFAGWLDRVATRFSNWVNSASGQNSIVSFMDRALVAMKSVWSFAKELTGVIADLLFNPDAQNAGNNIFDSMTEGLKDLRKHIRNGDVKKWFDDAQRFATKLGHAIDDVASGFEKLYDSGVVDAVGNTIVALSETFEFLAGAAGKITDFFQNDFVQIVTGIINPIWGMIQVIDKLAGGLFDVEDAADQAAFSLNNVNRALDNGARDLLSGGLLGGFPGGGTGGGFIGPTVDDLLESGLDALNQTGQDSGGYKPEWVNPYIDWANSLMDSGPGIAAQIREAIRSVAKQVGDALKDIALLGSRDEARDALKSLRESLSATADDIVESAQQGLNAAASALASAGSPAEVQRALRQVHAAQEALRMAERQQRVLERLSARLGKQQKSSVGRVENLLKGLNVQNATLADYAAARGRVTLQLERANQKLLEAIGLRAQYRAQVREAINSFGSLITAQAKVVDGIEQSLTAGDITSNLQDRLAKIKKFQENLRQLVAQGLSDAAYKQIIDAGVENGSLFAEALLAGGIGSIQDVNALVGEINDIAKQLGIETSNRLYQAGVDAARGLIDGLEALSDKLDRAATRLGNSIANAVKRALGIHSPSRVMFAAMDSVGDGTVKGLDAQHRKVGRAAQRFSKQIEVSPEVATYAARQGGGQNGTGVSGNQNDPRFRDLIIHTPTEDPHAVAMETLNEVTGRL